MQTATSETESKSRDLSICVHHYTLRAPCPKGQGILVLITTPEAIPERCEARNRKTHCSRSRTVACALVDDAGVRATHRRRRPRPHSLGCDRPCLGGFWAVGCPSRCRRWTWLPTPSIGRTRCLPSLPRLWHLICSVCCLHGLVCFSSPARPRLFLPPLLVSRTPCVRAVWVATAMMIPEL